MKRISVLLFLIIVSGVGFSKSFAQKPQIDATEKVLITLFEEYIRYYQTGNYKQATIIAKRALILSKEKFGSHHPSYAISLGNLAEVYRAQGYYMLAESMMKETLNIEKKILRTNHPKIGISLNNLAELYRAQGRYTEAEILFKLCLNIFEKSLGEESSRYGTVLNNLGSTYESQGLYNESKELYIESYKIRKKVLGPNHPDVGSSLNNLALLYLILEDYKKSENYFMRSLKIIGDADELDHLKFGKTLHNFAKLYHTIGKYERAETLYNLSLVNTSKVLGHENHIFAKMVNSLANLYLVSGQIKKAEILFDSSFKIFEKALGPNHVDTATSLNNLAFLYESQEKYSQAEKLYKRSLSIKEKALGLNHQSVGTILNNLVHLYKKLKRPDDEAAIRVRLAKMPEKGTRHIPLYFITNRLAKEGGGYGADLSAKRKLGRIVMQVPEAQVKNRAKRLGESLGLLEKAKSGQLTTAKSLKIIRSRTLKTPKQFAASVRASQARAAIFKNQALVFVHGYNTNFTDAMKRATQLSFDLQFDGILMPFTWPSQGTVSGYLTDVSHAEKSVDTLVNFLDQLRDTLPEIKINIIAHSLGNKVMLNALCKIAKRKGGKAHNFAQVISAHADVSYDDFEKLTSCFKDSVKGITLYVNEQDTALRLRCAGVFKCRAGNYARGYESADVVDTTQMSGGFFRTLSKGFDHDIFVRNPLLFSDIARLILTDQRPVEKRTQEFRPNKGPKGNIYWAYDKSFDPAAEIKKAAAK